MDRIVLTAMAKDVALRYPSAAELRADLLRFERGRPLVGGPLPAPLRPRPRSSPRRVVPRRRSRRRHVPPTVPCPRARRPAARKRRRWGAGRLRRHRARRCSSRLIVVARSRSSDFGESGKTVPLARRPQGHRPALPRGRGDARQGGVQGRPDRHRRADAGPRHGADAGPRGRAARSRKGGTITLDGEQLTVPLPNIVGTEPRRRPRHCCGQKNIVGRLRRRGRPRPAAGHGAAHRSRRGHPDPEELPRSSEVDRRQGAAGRRSPTWRPRTRWPRRRRSARPGSGSRRRPDRRPSDTVPGGHGDRHRSRRPARCCRAAPRSRCSCRRARRSSRCRTCVGTDARRGREHPHRSPASACGSASGASPAVQDGHRRRADPADGQVAPLSFVTITVGHLTLAAWYRGARSSRSAVAATRDRWAVLVSEVMLHQTQVPRVAAVYDEFLARFPTPAAMADGGTGCGHRRVGTARLPATGATAVGGVGDHRRPTAGPTT